MNRVAWRRAKYFLYSSIFTPPFPYDFYILHTHTYSWWYLLYIETSWIAQATRRANSLHNAVHKNMKYFRPHFFKQTPCGKICQTVQHVYIVETAVSYCASCCYSLSKIICLGKGKSELQCWGVFSIHQHVTFSFPFTGYELAFEVCASSNFGIISGLTRQSFGPTPNFPCKCVTYYRIMISFYSSLNKTLHNNNVLWLACHHNTFLLMLIRQQYFNELIKDPLRTRAVIVWSFCKVHSILSIILIAS